MNTNDHLSGGSYRREADGSLTLLERTGDPPCACEPPAQAAVEQPASPVTTLASRRNKRDVASNTLTQE
jgi:hypothetical protein